jgi:hypothetical protein
MAANMKHYVSDKRLVIMFKKFKDGSKIARRIGCTKQNVNARLRKLGIR